MDPADIKR